MIVRKIWVSWRLFRMILTSFPKYSGNSASWGCSGSSWCTSWCMSGIICFLKILRDNPEWFPYYCQENCLPDEYSGRSWPNSLWLSGNNGFPDDYSGWSLPISRNIQEIQLLDGAQDHPDVLPGACQESYASWKFLGTILNDFLVVVCKYSSWWIFITILTKFLMIARKILITRPACKIVFTSQPCLTFSTHACKNDARLQTHHH